LTYYKLRRKCAISASVLIGLSSIFAFVVYELPYLTPSLQHTQWWIFLTPETWDKNPITKEFGLWENVTALSYVISFIILVTGAICYSRNSRKPIYIPILFGCIFFIVAGEEISWGQYFLGFSTPGIMETSNLQGETNLHNLIAHDVNYFAIILVFWAYIAISPALSRLNRDVRDLMFRLNIPQPPLILACTAAFFFLLFSADLILGKWEHYLFSMREIRELILALAILGTAIDWLLEQSALRRARQQS